MSKCASCLGELIWAVTPSGRRVALDPEVIYVEQGEEWPRGVYRLERQATGAARAVPALAILRDTDAEVEGPLHHLHSDVCPHA